jgi:hypothetical protein
MRVASVDKLESEVIESRRVPATFAIQKPGLLL